MDWHLLVAVGQMMVLKIRQSSHFFSLLLSYYIQQQAVFSWVSPQRNTHSGRHYKSPPNISLILSASKSSLYCFHLRPRLLVHGYPLKYSPTPHNTSILPIHQLLTRHNAFRSTPSRHSDPCDGLESCHHDSSRSSHRHPACDSKHYRWGNSQTRPAFIR